MQKRICPGCGTTRHSADGSKPWVCDQCGSTIPVPEVGASESDMAAASED